MVAANQFKPRQARDAINRRLYKRLIIVETAIHRVFVMIHLGFVIIHRGFAI
ncbi:hypothetical protein [Nostoc sp. LEGE 12450]|uniref:hypothetical protein n=1 Tax=Nostoc sp. LEGE 12450 TaxID=1828643 RepID=UPI00187EDA6A|nr:hypothetical protein [Nostoc sp. LEGE 12450]MBE8990530.1 hypothetical protein [Nostoc sp. LEGE 12450]